MASDTVTATTDVARGGTAKPSTAVTRDTAARRPRSWWSPLTWRILAINMLAVALLGGGQLYLGEYQSNLVNAQIEALKTQGQIFAAALGEGAVTDALSNGESLLPELSRDMMRRLVEPTHTRARLFGDKGVLLGDTRMLGSLEHSVEVDELPPPDQGSFAARIAHQVYDRIVARIPWEASYPALVEPAIQQASDYPEVQRAYQGEIATAVHLDPTTQGLVMTAAVPVQHYKQVLGVVLLSAGSTEIEQAVRSVRFAILKLFLGAFGITVLLSLYLAGTIARPVRLLAAAAEQVRRGQGRQFAIPDFGNRRDEIGDLSRALRDMTAALWQRMDAIEHFATDVAHEIKNPLTSLRSAVETAARIDDPAKQRRLLAVVIEDVKRLDRLITDISNASRLDAELSRGESATVPLGSLLTALVGFYRETATPDAPQIALDLPNGSAASSLPVAGMEDRLVQVFRNLIDNAYSFSPPAGNIMVRARPTGDKVRVVVEDEGPGLPEGKLEAIFDRFYTERPAGEAFGTHSGLGLAIAKQIVEAHHGSIRAENRYDRDGRLLGARFIVDLPS
jgi:two-component system sensor histidine kinase ChvG